MRLRGPSWVLALALAVSVPAHAQTDFQLWSTLSYDWARSDRLTNGVRVEPKVLIDAPDGDPGWATLDVIPTVDYVVRNWMDATGELVLGYTAETDDLNSGEVTPRVGARFHVFSRDLPRLLHPHDKNGERAPKHRLVVRDYVRAEWRNLYYSDGSPSSSTWRFRNRLELQYPLNRAKVTQDGAWALAADWEWFIPVDDPQERFATKERIRAGFEFRHSGRWKYAGFYVWDRSRDQTSGGFDSTSHALEFCATRVVR